MKKGRWFPVFLLLAASAFGQGVQWYQGSFDQALSQAAAEDKKVLLFFNSFG